VKPTHDGTDAAIAVLGRELRSACAAAEKLDRDLSAARTEVWRLRAVETERDELSRLVDDLRKILRGEP
jgi:uncharacterized protein (DUF3084 family)